MTEYDYSPEAFERHLAKQEQIAHWVDQTLEQSPSNPFVPLPGEHSDIQTPHPHPHPHPQPAFYATPDGVISPTYSNQRRHGNSQRHSPSRSAPVVMPPGYRPVAGRSFSTPPAPVRNVYPLPPTPYTPYPTGSPLNPSPYSSPYHSPPNSYPSYSQTSFHSVPTPPQRIHVNPVIQQQHGANTHPYFQHSAPPQPVVVFNRGGGGYVVVPPPVHVISPQAVYETQNRGVNQGQHFFGKLKGLAMKSSKSKKYKRSRTDSY